MWRPAAHVEMSKLLRALVGIAIGLVLLWLALRDQDLEDVLAVWARSDGSWLLLGTAVYATSLIVRVARWSCLLAVVVRAPAKVVGEVLLVGSAMNNVLPARLGELVRADYGKRRLGSTRSALIATIVVERLADLATIVAALLCGMVVLEPVRHNTGSPWRIINFAAALGVCLFAVALAAVVLLPRMEGISRWVPRLARPRLDDLVTALQSWGEVRKSRFVTLTLGVWSLEAAALACILRASGIDCGLFELLIVLGLANLSTLAPTAPAYLGSYQFSYAIAFSALGWSAAHGIAIATTAQAFLLAPVTIVGISILVLRSTAMASAWSRVRADRRRTTVTGTLAAERRPNGDR
jgi:glycosyltransferase 2 family protein